MRSRHTTTAHLLPSFAKVRSLLPKIQICSAFELAARCLYCPINHKFEMISTFMANDFEYLKKALGFQRHDLRAELRSAKRKSRVCSSVLAIFVVWW